MMQFKYPGIFYLLIVLIIPLIIHLFNLQKFKKIAFSNVQFLKKVKNPQDYGVAYLKKDKIKNLSVVFLISNTGGVDYIVGLYAFPKIGNKRRKNLIDEYPNYDLINIGAEPKNILRLEKFVDLKTLNLKKVAGNQQISSQGWNYIEKENVGYLFDSIQKVNPDNQKLKQIKLRCLR